MVYAWQWAKWQVAAWRHARTARAVRGTSPLARAAAAGAPEVTLFSMIGTRVVDPYLVAVKTLHRQLGGGRIVILDDGTLTAADRALLDQQLGAPEIRDIAAVETGACPRGGTWERLLTILDLRRDGYVIQLDSDTVTTGPVPEVLAAIAAGRSFTLAGDAGAGEAGAVRPAAEFARARPASGHIQATFEAALDRIVLPGLAAPRYVRGCSGFAGFAPSPGGRVLAEALSRAGAALFGARWAEWGTEQITSNFVIANEPDPLVLPYARYLNHWDAAPPADARFVHFVGTHRFDAGRYRAATRAAIAALR